MIERSSFKMIVKALLKTVASMSPSAILLMVLIHYFPYTGLARIITVPTTLVINVLFIAIGHPLSLRLKRLHYKVLLWLLIIIITVAVTLFMYPQESGPAVVDILWDKLAGK
ncbi:hypothetical protein [Paenibacillus sp. FSL R7-0331]|uniref:hypothetical protein n=1 Tax=Paenibacillus sp. FSL R7-0331 TaxID=1536773 RepID=UPI0004F6BB98|nr:hypothetical protein [Paenibacillus sp. FSL R7-0331]AIQ54423.1 hypothetical protein R70331_24805 [Paenibacillus sp. FSL R7-0331]